MLPNSPKVFRLAKLPPGETVLIVEPLLPEVVVVSSSFCRISETGRYKAPTYSPFVTQKSKPTVARMPTCADCASRS